MEQRELTWAARGRLWFRLMIRGCLVVLVLVVVLVALPPVLSLLMPFVLALLMAWLLNPIVRGLQKRLKLGRGALTAVLILLLFFVVGGGLVAFLYTVVGELASLLRNWSVIWPDLQAQINEVSEFFRELFALLPDDIAYAAEQALGEFIAWIQARIPDILSALGALLLPLATSLPSWVIASVVFIMATYFTTADYPRLRFLASEQVPEEFRGFWKRVKQSAVAAFGGYIKAQVILSIAVFFILLAGYVLIGQSYALILALILAVVDFIPIIGAGTFMVPWAVVDLITGEYRHAVGLLVIWGVIVIFRRIAEPKVVGNQTGLSPILSLVSIYVGMQLAGVVGMILGPVLCMILANLGRDGLFSGTVGDIGMAVRDLSALLKSGKRD